MKSLMNPLPKENSKSTTSDSIILRPLKIYIYKKKKKKKDVSKQKKTVTNVST